MSRHSKTATPVWHAWRCFCGSWDCRPTLTIFDTGTLRLAGPADLTALLRAARELGLKAKGITPKPRRLAETALPAIAECRGRSLRHPCPRRRGQAADPRPPGGTHHDASPRDLRRGLDRPAPLAGDARAVGE